MGRRKQKSLIPEPKVQDNVSIFYHGTRRRRIHKFTFKPMYVVFDSSGEVEFGSYSLRDAKLWVDGKKGTDTD